MSEEESQKRVRRNRVRPRKGTGSESPKDIASLYPEGTPTDESGLPKSNVDIDERRARGIGALDAESARVMKQSRLTLAGKAAGRMVKWNDENDYIRFWECSQLFGQCLVKVVQLSPKADNSILAMPMNMFQGDLDALIRKISENHWRGGDATYSWRCYDRTHPQISTGQFELSARSEDEMSNNNRNQPPGPNNGGMTYPYGMPQMMGQMMPQMMGMMGMPQMQVPQMGMPQMQVPQMGMPQPDQVPQAVAPTVAPTPSSGDSNAYLLNFCLQLATQLAQSQALNASLQAQLMQFQAQSQATQQHPVARQEQIEKQQTPVEALKENMNTMVDVFKMSKNITQQIAESAGLQEEPATEEKVPEPPFPIQVKEIGGVNMLAEDGRVVTEFWPNAIVNSGKAVQAGAMFFEKVGQLIQKYADSSQGKTKTHDEALERAQKLAEIDAQRAASMERAALAKQALAEVDRQYSGQRPPQVVVVEGVPKPSNGVSQEQPEPFPLSQIQPEQAPTSTGSES